MRVELPSSFVSELESTLLEEDDVEGILDFAKDKITIAGKIINTPKIDPYEGWAVEMAAKRALAKISNLRPYEVDEIYVESSIYDGPLRLTQDAWGNVRVGTPKWSMIAEIDGLYQLDLGNGEPITIVMEAKKNNDCTANFSVIDSVITDLIGPNGQMHFLKVMGMNGDGVNGIIHSENPSITKIIMNIHDDGTLGQAIGSNLTGYVAKKIGMYSKP